MAAPVAPSPCSRRRPSLTAAPAGPASTRRSRRGRHQYGPHLLHAAHRGALQPVRRPSRPCLRRWPAADRAALLHERGRADLHRRGSRRRRTAAPTGAPYLAPGAGFFVTEATVAGAPALGLFCPPSASSLRGCCVFDPWPWLVSLVAHAVPASAETGAYPAMAREDKRGSPGAASSGPIAPASPGPPAADGAALVADPRFR